MGDSLRLLTFGGLELLGTGELKHPYRTRRLGLLALLSTAGARAMSRDELVAYLWPDAGADAARHALEQLLYAMRRAWGEDVFLGVNPLRLNPARVSADVAEFLHHVSTGDLKRAVALYRGPFLQGVHFGTGGELDAWAESERARLARLHRIALEQLAGAAEQRADAANAVRWWHLLSQADPFSDRVAVQLMNALAGAGDRAGALRHAAEHTAFIDRELASPPDDAVTRLAASLRASGPGPQHATVAAPAADASVAPTQDAGGSDSTVAFEETRHNGWKPLRAAAVLVVLIVFGRAISTYIRPPLAVTRKLDATQVLVPPFASVSTRALQLPSGDTLATLLRGFITGEADLTAVEAADGAESGARYVIRGIAVASPGQRAVLSVRLISVPDEAVHASSSTAGSIERIPELIQRLAADLLAAHVGVPDDRRSLVTAARPEVWRAYLKGRAQLRRDDVNAALQSFSRALNADSLFSLAALDYVVNTGWLLRYQGLQVDQVLPLGFGLHTVYDIRDIDEWRRAMRLAWNARDQLSPRDRTLLAALHGRAFPAPEYAARVLEHWEHAANVAADNAEVQNNLGTILLNQGPAIGLAGAQARAAAAFRSAAMLDSTLALPLIGSIEVAAFDHDTAALRAASQRFLARHARHPLADYVRWRQAAAADDAAAMQRTLSVPSGLSLESLDRMVWAAQVSGVGLVDAELASQEILRRTAAQQGRRAAIFNAHILALNRGQQRAALELLQGTRELTRATPDVWWERVIEAGLFGGGDVSAARTAASEAAATLRNARGDAEVLALRRFNVALWHVAHEDTTGAAAAIASLHALGSSDAHRIRATILEVAVAVLTRGVDRQLPLARLDSVVRLGCCIPKWTGLLAARLHERSGDMRGALGVLRAGRWTYAPSYWATYLREEGRIAHGLGERAAAIRAYEHYLALRSDPDPPLQSEAAGVRQALQRARSGL